jgi:penicillin-binding protein 1A
MQDALADKPPTPFRVPSGIRLVRVDADSGLLPGTATEKVILEAFIPGTEPRETTPQNYDIYDDEPGTVSFDSEGQGGFFGQQQQGLRPDSNAPRAGGLY